MSDYFYFKIKCPHCKKETSAEYWVNEHPIMTKCEKCDKLYEIEMTFKAKKIK